MDKFTNTVHKRHNLYGITDLSISHLTRKCPNPLARRRPKLWEPEIVETAVTTPTTLPWGTANMVLHIKQQNPPQIHSQHKTLKIQLMPEYYLDPQLKIHQPSCHIPQANSAPVWRNYIRDMKWRMSSTLIRVSCTLWFIKPETLTLQPTKQTHARELPRPSTQKFTNPTVISLKVIYYIGNFGTRLKITTSGIWSEGRVVPWLNWAALSGL